MATQKKIATVASLSDKVSRAKAIVFVDYRGLKHRQMEELRRILREHAAEFTVTKNRLMQRALTADVKLTDTTAALFAYADEVSPLTALLTYLKAAGAGKPKLGLLGGTVLSGADVARLAALPPRSVLLGMLAAQLNAPIQRLHAALSWNINALAYALRHIHRSKATEA